LAGSAQGSDLAILIDGFQGNETPVSYTPFLNRLRQALSGRYILTFEAPPKAKEARLRVSTELPHVAISAPAEVWVGKQRSTGSSSFQSV
jgi:hypothetical protein